MAVGNSLGIPAKPRTVNDAGGVTLSQIVVQGTNEGEVKNPAAANGSKIRGVVEGLDANNGANGSRVSVRDHGEGVCIASAAIAVGDYVNIAGTTGRVKTVSEASTTVIWLVGEALSAATAAGDQVRVDFRLLGSRFVQP